MAQKQMIGTNLYVVNSQTTLKIPVAESYLPVQSIKAPSNELSKDLIYSNDARNPYFSLNITASDGSKEQNHNFQLSKEMMKNFFNQIEKIQDEINSYM